MFLKPSRVPSEQPTLWSMHWYVGWGAPLAASAQTCPDGQLPQLPPQPSSPHCRPWLVQTGWHWHLPCAQVWGHWQAPHWPPQPSLPQVLPAQLGAQVGPQTPFAHAPPPGQAPWHRPPQPSGSPHSLPAQAGVHEELHAPLTHDWPAEQVPHAPPQPSGPHVLLPQLGVHVTQAVTSHT